MKFLFCIALNEQVMFFGISSWHT